MKGYDVSDLNECMNNMWHFKREYAVVQKHKISVEIYFFYMYVGVVGLLTLLG